MKLLLIILLATLFLKCKMEEGSEKQVESIEHYEQEIKEWRALRLERLKRPNSWLSLAGLFRIQEGPNTFGSAKDSDFLFPSEKSAAHMGVLVKKDSVVTLQTRAGVDIYNGSEPVRELHLENDSRGNPTILSYKTLSWYIIKRGEQLLVRLKDSTNSRITNFKGIDHFPIDREWRIKAKFEPYDSIKQIPMPTVLGNIVNSPCPGLLIFKVKGEEFRIAPIAASAENDFFLIFSDETSGRSTYGAGRFLVVAKPDEDGYVYIDFNKSYNPPCAFSEFATCSFPPEQNHLPIEITAGEKDYGMH